MIMFIGDLQEKEAEINGTISSIVHSYSSVHLI